jgi:hypothetical protein
MKKEYKKHIVTTTEHQVWLHRTHTSNIEEILKKGLYFGTGDLSSTATLQPRDLEGAENAYQQTHKGSNAVVVIKIPKRIASKYYLQSEGLKGKGHEGYEADKEVTYFDSGFYIQRQHIHGWIDKETDEYHPNPYLDEPQNLTDRNFPPEFYGGLERDLIKPERQQPRAEKIQKLKKGKLPRSLEFTSVP